jgi:hypothetical protein
MKLFLVDKSNQILWIVGSPHANNWTLSKLEDVHKANAKAKDGFVSRPSVEAEVSDRKTGRQEEQRSPANCGRNIAEQSVQKGYSELYDTNDEQEGEKKDDAGEDDTGEEDAGEGIEEGSERLRRGGRSGAGGRGSG